MHLGEAGQPEPLRREMRRQTLSPSIREHALDLTLEFRRIPQLPLRCRLDQLIVGARAPEEIREARGQFQIVDAIVLPRLDGLWDALEPEDELGSRNDALHCG